MANRNDEKYNETMTEKKKNKIDYGCLALRMAYSIDMRGVNEDTPVFVFIGDPCGKVLREAFEWLVRGRHIADGFTMQSEHAPIWRNGHAYRRWAFTLHQPNFDFCSLETIRLIVESRLQAAGHDAKFIKKYSNFINI